MRVIAVAHHKGGCGKTTVCLNLASVLANSGVRTLLIDNDPQGHATRGLGVGPRDVSRSMRDLYLTSGLHVSDLLHRVKQNLDVVPADADLAEVEADLSQDPYRLYHLRDRMGWGRLDHDVCLIDNPPQLGILTLSALLAAREVLVPVDPTRFSLESLRAFEDTIETLRVERGHGLRLHVLANGFDARTHFARDLLEELLHAHPRDVLQSRIPVSVRLPEAAARGLPIDAHDPRGRPHADFGRLAQELLARSVEVPREELESWDEMLHGPRRSRRGVVFEVFFPQADHVSVTGDFCDWSVEGHALEKQPDGTWHVELDMEPGIFEYKFIVDGVWKVDPRNPEQVRNSYGQLNSVLTVRPAPEGAREGSSESEVER